MSASDGDRPHTRSAARLDHRDDARPDSGRQARPCINHSSEVAVCLVERGHFRGHFPRIPSFARLCRARLRIANPPSSVRLRPEPLTRRPSRSPGKTGFRGGLLRFSPTRPGAVVSPLVDQRCWLADSSTRWCAPARGAVMEITDQRFGVNRFQTMTNITPADTTTNVVSAIAASGCGKSGTSATITETLRPGCVDEPCGERQTGCQPYRRSRLRSRIPAAPVPSAGRSPG
jgi:hypothetical protein